MLSQMNFPQDEKKRAKIHNLFGGSRIMDVLLFRPFRYEILKKYEQHGDIVEKTNIFARIMVGKHIPSMRPSVKMPYKIEAFLYESGEVSSHKITMVFFAGKIVWWKNMFREGKSYYIRFRASFLKDGICAVHPQKTKFFVDENSIEPVYSVTSGIKHEDVQKAILYAIQNVGNAPIASAVKQMHFPQKDSDIEASRKMLAHLEIAAYKIANSKIDIAATPIVKHDISNVKIPFDLTNDQKAAVQNLLAFQENPIQNLCLLQGDVGSGKTIVAFLVAINAILAGLQVVFMAPTSILAKQIHNSFSVMFSHIPSILLTSDVKKLTLKSIASGETKMIVGTHAVFSSDVIFSNLGFIIIDEQHRFGVKQRLALAKKGSNPKCLLMSATPIPRTLAVALYGQISTMNLKEKPKNRPIITTAIISKNKIDSLVESIKKAIARGEQIYWVVPFIEEDELVANIPQRLLYLEKYFAAEVGFIHGKMPEKKKDEQMLKFYNGETKILLATSVIEVGIDVQSATVIIIEDAQLFGLSSLHQLRGRVGRGVLPSYCILIQNTDNETSMERLQALKSTTDGFEIAEIDMNLRGSGKIFGTEQTGKNEFRFFDITQDGDLLGSNVEYDEETLLNIFGYTENRDLWGR